MGKQNEKCRKSSNIDISWWSENVFVGLKVTTHTVTQIETKTQCI